MKSVEEILAKREQAYTEQGWQPDATREAPINEEERDRRLYAEGVEAGLLWVIENAGDPFPR
jgi:hypothetical protein